MKKKILLTRPRASSERWAELLARHGLDSIIEPLLTIEPRQAQRPEGSFQACFITSANALDALEELKPSITDLLPLPCFCVGASTAEAARLSGFTNIYCGTSDSAALAQLALKTLANRNQPLLHIAGDTVDGKAQDILSQNGFTLTPWVVYHAIATEDFTPATCAAFKSGEISDILIFSPRSARILLSIIEKNNLTEACHGIAAIGLSQAVADVLKLLPWHQLRVAAMPTEEQVLACLHKESRMTSIEKAPPEPTPTSALAPSKCRRKTRCLLWLLAVVLVLAGAGSLALVKCPWLYPAQQTGANVTALERRVSVLETHLAALNEAPTIAPQANTNDSATADVIKDLQNQVKQMQNEDKSSQQSARKLIASAFAFWDVREAAKSGRPFATPLADLRHAAGNDAAMIEQIAKLEPYAATPPPTLAQLRETLTVQEAGLPVAEPQEANPSLWSRIVSIFRPLISIHPLHNPAFAALEKALDSGDAQASLDAFKALPDDTQKNLSAWKDGLEARNIIDSALRALTASFATTPATETAP